MIKKGDLFGGLVAAIVALPAALAFGVQSGLGAIAGLYGAIAMGLFSSLLGGTKTQVSGPTGPMTVVSSVLIVGLIAQTGSLEAALPIIIVTFSLTGVFQIVFGLLKMGQYVKYIPYPVVSGFMSGLGIIIALLQRYPLFGGQSPAAIMDIIKTIALPVSQMNILAFVIALATLLVIYGFPKITKKVPSTLVALLAITALAAFLGRDVPTIGALPQGLPSFHLDALFQFDFTYLRLTIVSALTLAALGSIDALLTSVVADNMTKTQHNSNQELIGQGVGNIVAGMVGGIPGAGATLRTVANIKAGGTTKFSGLIHGLVLLAIVLGLGTLAKYVPLAVLAGILISVAISIMDRKGLKHVFHVPKGDAAVMIIVLVVTVTVDLLQAVAIGVVLSALLFMKKMGQLIEEGTTAGHLVEDKEKPREDEKGIPFQLQKQIYIKHLYGPLFFGFTDAFKRLVRSTPDVDVVIFRMEQVPYIDQSGLYALEDAILYLEMKGVEVCITGLNKQVEDMLAGIDIIPDLIPPERKFEIFNDCIQAIAKEKSLKLS